jgi:hypothetical protein
MPDLDLDILLPRHIIHPTMRAAIHIITALLIMDTDTVTALDPAFTFIRVREFLSVADASTAGRGFDLVPDLPAALGGSGICLTVS